MTKLTTKIAGADIEFMVPKAILKRMIVIAAAMAPGKFFSICTFTSPKMAKEKSNPFTGRIQKLSEIKSQAYIDYEGIVNRRRAAAGLEPDFLADENNQGTRVFMDGEWTPFLVNMNKGRIYVQYINRDTDNTTFYLDGKNVGPKEDPTWNIYHAPKKPAADTKQGLDDDMKVKINGVGLDGVYSLRAGGMDTTFSTSIPVDGYVTML